MHYEPGEVFEIEFGNDRVCEVRAMGLRTKAKAVGLFEKLRSNPEPREAYEALEDVLHLIVVDCDDDFVDTVDERLASEIIAKALEASLPDEDTKKKSARRR